MSKKKKIVIHNNEDLGYIDAELDSALASLESANLNVGNLLEEIEASDQDDVEPSTSEESTSGSPEENAPQEAVVSAE